VLRLTEDFNAAKLALQEDYMGRIRDIQAVPIVENLYMKEYSSQKLNSVCPLYE
jgi:hypothetical protein